MDYDAYDALLHHVFKQTQGDAWFKPSEESSSAGVCLRIKTGHFRVFPYENKSLAPFEAAVKILNPIVAVKVRSAAVHAALGFVAQDAQFIYIDANTRIQIIDTMAHLPTADKEQCGAFLRDERVMVCWFDDIDGIIPLVHDFEAKLIKLIWRERPTLKSYNTLSTNISTAPSHSSSDEVNEEKKTSEDRERNPNALEAHAMQLAEERAGQTKNTTSWWPFGKSKPKNKRDPEKGKLTGRDARPIRLLAPLYNGMGAALGIYFIGTGVATLFVEAKQDESYIRFALLVTAPFTFCVALFFALNVMGIIGFLIGPIAQYHENSRYYSAVKPEPNTEVDLHLPHITIELPVYKESLEQTIAPSVFSLKKAMQTYARQGGTSAIFVHDDGLQLISEHEREERIAFYANHNIGWVARPPHSGAPDGYKRAGRFKKASNMNYGLQLSLKLEKHLAILEEEEKAKMARGEAIINDPMALCLEDQALALAVEETYAETGNRWRPWASNGRSIRIGEIILLCDSDTLIPEDCFRDAARELAECPDVAIIQHESEVMQVAHHYFENGIAHFTRRINKAISMGCATGEIAPFVGHNAFLRWSALQDASFVDIDGVRKCWSESNVSEDFDMALRLQLKGYIIRWATYSDGGFREGVSLTADDELNRWQKYAYGCNELIFNPLITWWRLGPINKQLRIFVWSKAPVHYKLSMMAYMFSYYGIACSFALSLLNYLILGFQLNVDGFYMHSFEIFLACLAVFLAAGNLSFSLLQYRLGLRSLLSALVENFSWLPFFFFFFGGLSIHLSAALLAHMFSYNITWGATKKEVERSNFFIEVPRILKRFWLAFLLSFGVMAGMIILTTDLLPLGWRIPGYDWAVMVPLITVCVSHILWPIVLNPYLMVFSY